MLISTPRTMLPFLDAALLKAQTALLQRPLPDRHLLILKENVHARLVGLAHFLDKASPNKISPSIGDISSAHIDKLITVRGTIVRTGAVQLLESRRLYECTRCKHRFVVAADLEQGATVQLPGVCPSARDKPCRGSSFRHCNEVSLYTNYQEVQVQEGRQCLTMGCTPRTLTVVFQDEIADTCQVGGNTKSNSTNSTTLKTQILFITLFSSLISQYIYWTRNKVTDNNYISHSFIPWPRR